LKYKTVGIEDIERVERQMLTLVTKEGLDEQLQHVETSLKDMEKDIGLNR
jgi:hypothetical protein